MAYTYKKDFFGKWKRQHGISTSELTRVLNFNSPDKIRIWAGEKALPEVNNEKLKEEDRGWIPLKHILRLCNHYGLKLSDFISNAEEPAPQKIRKDTRQQEELASLKLELLQARLDHQEELNAVHAEYREREDRIRAQYDKTIQELLRRLPDHQATMESIGAMVNDPLNHDTTHPKRG